jgi:site-specific DNA-methyltransferase (adenine-specific)
MLIKIMKIISNKHKPYYTKDNGNLNLFHGDSLELLKDFKSESVDMIFADPPYFLSNDGITCQSGKMVKVNKGKWDVGLSPEDMREFNKNWLSECKRILKQDGTIFVSGTSHNIYNVGFCLQELGYKIINDIAWFKINPPPNLSCRYFTHSTETILWAKKDKKAKHLFNYSVMKAIGDPTPGKQMLSLWKILPPRKEEKKYGRHPTQKPLALMERIVLASTNKGDVILDPFNGSGTTGVAALINDRKYIGIEYDKKYLDVSIKRIKDTDFRLKLKN